MRYLKATLAAPLASFGGPAASGTRKDAGGPQRSAVIGLVSACLGLDRAAGNKMLDLSKRLGILVRMDRPGDSLVDYHTSQSPSDKAKGAWAKDYGGAIPTRRTLLSHAAGVDELKTALTEREYRTDTVLTLLLWDRRESEGPGFLDQVAEAMERPVFVPTLGRRACPLGLPMAPVIIRASGVIEALQARADEPDAPEARKGFPRHNHRTRRDFIDQATDFGRMPAGPATCHCDMDAELGGTVVDKILHYRRDEPRDRLAWLFSERREMTFSMPGESAT